MAIICTKTDEFGVEMKYHCITGWNVDLTTDSVLVILKSYTSKKIREKEIAEFSKNDDAQSLAYRVSTYSMDYIEGLNKDQIEEIIAEDTESWGGEKAKIEPDLIAEGEI